MTIIIDKKEDDQRQLIVTVDVPEDEVGRRLRETARRLSRDVRIPGFRQGKAPYNVMVQRLGETTLRLETLEHMLDDLFQQVMDDLETPPYLPTTVEKMNLDPMQVVFAVPLQPVVTLGDYRALRRTLEPVTVGDDAVDAALEQIRQRHQVVEPVERPADFDDMVAVGGRGAILNEDGEEDEVILEEEHVDLLLDNNRLVFGPEFVTHLVGMSAGDEKVFEINLPDEFDDRDETRDIVAAEPEADEAAEAAPKPVRRARFDIALLEVKRRELPALDDELARSEGEYETLADLREAVRLDLMAEAERQARANRLEAMIDDLAADATLIYPPQAVDHELDHIIEEFKGQVQQTGFEWENYLRTYGSSDEEIRERFKESAARRLERGLLLSQFIEAEWLRVDDGELKDRVATRLEGVNPDLHDYLQDYFLQGRGRASLANDIMLDKVHDRIVAILTGDAPDLADLEAEARAVAAGEEEE